MDKLNFKIPEIEIGIPDLRFIKKMSSDQFAVWIRARLNGSDPYYALSENRGESRHAIFIWIFENTASDGFRNEFHLAIRDLLIEADEIPWDKKTSSDLAFMRRLIDLVGHFYATYNQSASTRRKNGVHSRIEEILTRLCSPQGPLAKKSDYKDIYLRALFALSEVEGVPTLDWEEIFKIKGGIFATAGFGAIAKRDPVRAAYLLPKFILAADKNPDDVSLDEEIFTLFDSNENNPKMMTDINKAISEAFRDKPRERAIFDRKITELGLDNKTKSPRKDMEHAIDILSRKLGIDVNRISQKVTGSERISDVRKLLIKGLSGKGANANRFQEDDFDWRKKPPCRENAEISDEDGIEKTIKPWHYDSSGLVATKYKKPH